MNVLADSILALQFCWAGDRQVTANLDILPARHFSLSHSQQFTGLPVVYYPLNNWWQRMKRISTSLK